MLAFEPKSVNEILLLLFIANSCVNLRKLAGRKKIQNIRPVMGGIGGPYSSTKHLADLNSGNTNSTTSGMNKNGLNGYIRTYPPQKTIKNWRIVYLSFAQSPMMD